MAIAIDTLQAVKVLQAANFTSEQAEAIVGVMISEEGLATKEDVRNLGKELRTEMRAQEQRITIKVAVIFFSVLSAMEVVKHFIAG